jgi:tRNA G18 (ribose-2'-O)-methylase SpoU
VTPPSITLVGDGIENPWNARTMIDAAAMFGAGCLFRDRVGLAGAWQQVFGSDGAPPLLSKDALAVDYAPIIALENAPGAAPIYGFRPSAGPRPALIAGNERRGIARETLALSDYTVQIPLASRGLNSLNVAAAAAVALYELARGGGAPQQVRTHPERRRPELLLMGPRDHVELGSAIRSAGAFGWERVLVEDRARVWFGSERGMRTEGRAAARRHRNPIRIVPAAARERYMFERVCVVTCRPAGMPLHRAALAGGAGHLLVIPDEDGVALDAEPWERLGKVVHFVHLDLPRRPFVYHYRLIATIALAEVARQIGRRADDRAARRTRGRPLYDRSLRVLDGEQGETVFLDELDEY